MIYIAESRGMYVYDYCRENEKQIRRADIEGVQIVGSIVREELRAVPFLREFQLHFRRC